jgi:hypothetical protein
MPPDEFHQSLQSLIDSEMGWALRFPNHEDGGELEPFVWDGRNGEFTLLKLIQTEGWMQPLTMAEVLQRWLAPEQTGSVNGEQWLVPEQDRAGILVDEATQVERVQLYQELVALLPAQLQNLQAFQLSSGSDYALTLVVGQVVNQAVSQAADQTVNQTVNQTADQTADRWLSVAPLVPHATQINAAGPIQMTLVAPSDRLSAAAPSTVEEGGAQGGAQAQIQALLARLGSLQRYGYYGGGYEQIHDYRLVLAVGSSLEQAIERGIEQAGLLTVYRFEGFQPQEDAGEQTARLQSLNQFLRQTLAECWVYRFSFWNDEHCYIIGPDADGNWGGVVLRSRFTYNP